MLLNIKKQKEHDASEKFNIILLILIRFFVVKTVFKTLYGLLNEQYTAKATFKNAKSNVWAPDEIVSEAST